MFIRKDKTGKSASGKPCYTHKLLESYGDKSTQKYRHRTILMLGANYDFPESLWKELCALLEGKLKGTPQPFPASAVLESEAQRLYRLIMDKRGKDVPNGQSGIPLDGYFIGDFEITNVKSIGPEYLAMKGAKELGLSEIFAELGFSKTQCGLFMALIIGRMVNPGNVRSTLGWLKGTSGLGFLLGIDFSPVKAQDLRRACDALLAKKDEIEDRICKNIPNPGDCSPTIVIYDLTKAYYDGRPQHPGIKRLLSYETSFDAPQIGLGVMLDSNGFILKSVVFHEFVSEPKSLDDILEAMKPAPDTLFIMDSSMATEESVSYLKEKGFRYLVVSKDKKCVFEFGLAESLVTPGHREILLYSKLSDDGLENRVYFCTLRSFVKKKAILCRHMGKYEVELKKLNAKWKAKGAKKDLDEANRELAGLRKEFRIVSHHYYVKVLEKQVGEANATRIANGVTFSMKEKEDTKLTHPGVTCLKTNDLSMNAEEVWQTYNEVPKVKRVSRCLEYEPGFLPNFNPKKMRIESSLNVSALAYQCINMILKILRINGVSDSWGTIVDTLSNHKRVTLTIKNELKGTIQITKATEPEEQHIIYYKAANLPIIPK
ncbi:MAG: hypothetical protein LBF40_07380 [Deltaproteobacteria bacterium]|jgi:hypothetical protein|nr:hypothetical protein [Deltaproteobacteria bacterium]